MNVRWVASFFVLCTVATGAQAQTRWNTMCITTGHVNSTFEFGDNAKSLMNATTLTTQSHQLSIEVGEALFVKRDKFELNDITFPIFFAKEFISMTKREMVIRTTVVGTPFIHNLFVSPQHLALETDRSELLLNYAPAIGKVTGLEFGKGTKEDGYMHTFECDGVSKEKFAALATMIGEYSLQIKKNMAEQ